MVKLKYNILVIVPLLNPESEFFTKIIPMLQRQGIKPNILLISSGGDILEGDFESIIIDKKDFTTYREYNVDGDAWDVVEYIGDDRLADKVHQEKRAFVLDDEIFENFGLNTLHEIYSQLKNRCYEYYSQKRFLCLINRFCQLV